MSQDSHGSNQAVVSAQAAAEITALAPTTAAAPAVATTAAATAAPKPKKSWLQTEMTETGRKHVLLFGHKVLSYPTATAKFLRQQRRDLKEYSLHLNIVESICNAQKHNDAFDPRITSYCHNNALGVGAGPATLLADMRAVLQDSNLISAYHYRPDRGGRTVPAFVVVHGLGNHLDLEIAVNLAKNYNVPFFFNEDGFLRSATTYVDNCDPMFTRCLAFNFDPYGPYYDCSCHSWLERMLDAPELNLSAAQLTRARACIDFLIAHHLTKYNHQPINDQLLDDVAGTKVLVVDQSYGDQSIYRGGANDRTFDVMLEQAIKENPDSTILVKTHPDAMASDKVKAYYAGVKAEGRVRLLTAPINPISLIKQCDRVYVCTSQFGFEALLCGKDVQIFGRPFYAGYGLGTARQEIKRPRTRTLEEMFYIAYIEYVHYLNPFTNQPCEIEELMECLIKLREMYHQAYSGAH